MRRCLMILMCFFSFNVFADAFVAGKDYEILPQSASLSENGIIPVAEFFSYGCPWCFRLEPYLLRWRNEHQKTVQFSRIPVIFNKDWAKYAEAYYVIQQLKLEDSLHDRLFDSIQTKKQTLKTSDAMVQFFTQAGVSEKQAKSAFMHSTFIDLRIAESMQLMSQYQIRGVPAVVVNGQYKTDLQMAKGEERFFQIIDFLLDLSQKKVSIQKG